MIALWHDDFEVGQTFALGSFAFTREKILAFAHRFDPQAYHLSDAGAAAGPFGRLAASGFHTSAAWMKCYVASTDATRRDLESRGLAAPASGPSPGFTNLKWPRPVFVDDVVSYATRVTGLPLHPKRADWGFVESVNDGHNQHGELVFSFEGKVLARRQPI